MSLKGSLRRAGARIGVWAYRHTNGRAMTSSKNPRVLAPHDSRAALGRAALHVRRLPGEPCRLRGLGHGLGCTPRPELVPQSARGRQDRGAGSRSSLLRDGARVRRRRARYRLAGPDHCAGSRRQPIRREGRTHDPGRESAPAAGRREPGRRVERRPQRAGYRARTTRPSSQTGSSDSYTAPSAPKTRYRSNDRANQRS